MAFLLVHEQLGVSVSESVKNESKTSITWCTKIILFKINSKNDKEDKFNKETLAKLSGK